VPNMPALMPRVDPGNRNARLAAGVRVVSAG
jgi:hypothetical protein